MNIYTISDTTDNKHIGLSFEAEEITQKILNTVLNKDLNFDVIISSAEENTVRAISSNYTIILKKEVI